ncbi:hypothetical protein ACN4EG_26675 [Alkalinema pantanalense CENA528]|uniref:hypothetical protein n=1 Tax=Alkalinema pantanalense TaxID=1620705 RepID=UPI003D6F6D96
MGIVLSIALAACAGGQNQPNATVNSANSGGSSQSVELTLVGYAVPKAAHDAIIPKFQAQWKKDHGQTVTFRQSYGARAHKPAL